MAVRLVVEREVAVPAVSRALVPLGLVSLALESLALVPSDY
ncbi:MAG: hypothetical protein U0X20_00120 [Caldilineaceae bacterium]